MKTYATHGACLRYRGHAFPVHVGASIRWSGDFDIGEVVRQAEFGARLGNELASSAFDRIFRLRRQADQWAIETVLSRDVSSGWPHLSLFSTEAEAAASFAKLVAGYESDVSWGRRS